MPLLPPAFLYTVVALGIASQDGNVNYNATGFMVGYPTGVTGQNGVMNYWVFLVTNRHVWDSFIRSKETLRVRFNKHLDNGSNVYNLDVTDTDHWTLHPDEQVDVAVCRIDAERLNFDGIKYGFFQDEQHALTRNQLWAWGISEGDGCFVLGFPMGMAGEDKNYPIVRQGVIARIRDWFDGNNRSFMVDASIFPGNSGGPVLLKPEMTSIQGTNATLNCSLIGMVSAYVPYTESAVSQQTGRTRMIAEENSGLGMVVPYDLIQDTIRLGIRKIFEQSYEA